MVSRLPIPGSDDDVWGVILNNFLQVSLNNHGTIITSAIQTAGAITTLNGKTPSSGVLSINTSDLGDTSISSPSNGQVLSYNSSTNKWTNATSSSSPVASVFGRTGTITAQSGDYTAAQVTGALVASNNLSDVASASTARTNLGLGSAATQNKVAAGNVGVLDATDPHVTGSATKAFAVAMAVAL